MYYAKCARAVLALGATLVAMSAQSIAAESSSSTNGIDAGGIAGIDAGGIAGIDAGGIAGIDAGGIAGIDAGGIAGIDAGGVLGIDAGGIAGIDAGGIAGIDAGGVLGIDAGGIAGIDAGGIAGIDAGGIAGIDAGGIAGIDAGGVTLAGPVDSIDRVNGVFGSMGQIVMASQDMLSSMTVGDFVAVQGSVISSGWYYADSVNVSNQGYVPGSTEVFITGMLSSINQMNGTAQMGDLIIDYTPSLGSNDAPSGDMWSFHGTRSSMGGTMISNRTEGVR